MNYRRRAYWFSIGAIVFLLSALLVLQPSDAASIVDNAFITGKTCTPTASTTSSGDNGSFDHIYPGAKPASATPVPCVPSAKLQPTLSKTAKVSLTPSPTKMPRRTSTPTIVRSATPTGIRPYSVVRGFTADAIIVDSIDHESPPYTTDDGKCTLAEAIVAVNTRSLVDTCHGETGATRIVLTDGIGDYDVGLSEVDNTSYSGGSGTLINNGFPIITGNSNTSYSVTIDGNNTTISVPNCVYSNTTMRLFEIGSNATVTFKNVQLGTGCIKSYQNGSAFYNGGTLQLNGVILFQNVGAGGGAIYNPPGHTLTIVGSTFDGNVSNNGGTVYNDGTLNSTNSLFINSGASVQGGVIFNGTDAYLTLTRNTFVGNYGPLHSGGAIYNISTHPVSITGTCFLNNGTNGKKTPNANEAVFNASTNVPMNIPGNWWSSDDSKEQPGGDGRPGTVGPNTDPNADRISNYVTWSPQATTPPSLCRSSTEPTHQDWIGVYRPSNGTFYLRNGISGTRIDATFLFGPPNFLPVTGDWNGDGIDTVGVFDPTTRIFTLSNDYNAPSFSLPAYQFAFGNAGDVPFAGRWSLGATHDGVGVYRPSNGVAWLKNELTGGSTYDTQLVFGNPGDMPVADNWNANRNAYDGSGTSGVGTFRPGNSNFYLANQVCDCVLYDDYHLTFGTGINNPRPVAGDWIAQGHAGIGVYDASNATFYLRTALTTGGADYVTQFGAAGDLPVAGHWQAVCPSPSGGIQPASVPCVVVPPSVTPTPTIVPGVCQVTVNTQSLAAYLTERKAAVADPTQKAGDFLPGNQLEVYARSEIYINLVQVGYAQFPLQRYWIDSGSGSVSLVAGSNCNQLPIVTLQPAINNPISQPVLDNYPLRLNSPTTSANAELYQFALVNGVYASTANRHPGIDFIEGTVQQGIIGTNVVSVADGNLIGYCDPNLAPNPILVDPQQTWVLGVSPTDQCTSSSTPSDNHSRAYIVVRYGNLITIYAHLQPGLRIGSSVNAPIVKNQLLGKTAQNDEGPHLHFEGRTYGQTPFNLQQPPLVFINTWQYFDATNRNIINQNLQNRFNDDGNAVRGYNNQFDGGTQKTQCFRSPVSPPSGAPSNARTGIQP